MKKLIKKSSIGIITLLAVFAFQAFCLPSSAKAVFVDRSDELPGMSTNWTPYIIGAVVVAGLIVFRPFKKDNDNNKSDTLNVKIKDSDQGEKGDKNSETEESSDTTSRQSNNINISNYQDKQHIGFYFDIDHEQHDRIKNSAFDISDMTFKVGLKVGF